MAEKYLDSRRVLSIDVLRGFVMFMIIGGADVFRVVFNSLGMSFLASQLEHASWNGVTFWDTIFPMFIFIMGVVIPFSRALEGERKSVYFHILERTLVLIFLGLVVNGVLNRNFSELRYMSVLGRIGFCYFFSSIIFLHTKMKGQIFVLVSILIGYWVMMTQIPGFDLTPSGNLAGYVDKMFLPGVLLREYGDAEGLLSTLPAIATSLFGLLSGEILKTNHLSKNRRLIVILSIGVFSILFGLLWSVVFPLNKFLWTSSYVLFTGGLNLVLLSILYGLIDIVRFNKWAFPFIIVGMNSILIYMLTGLNVFNFVKNTYLQLIIKLLFMYYLYRKKIIFTI